MAQPQMTRRTAKVSKSSLAEQILFWKNEAGLTVTEIARMFGCARSTVYRVLETGELKERPAAKGRGGGAPRKTHCIRNHDLAVHGAPASRGGRQCMECKRARDRKAAKEKYDRKKAEANGLD